MNERKFIFVKEVPLVDDVSISIDDVLYTLQQLKKEKFDKYELEAYASSYIVINCYRFETKKELAVRVQKEKMLEEVKQKNKEKATERAKKRRYATYIKYKEEFEK